MYIKECKWCKQTIEVEKQCLYALHIANCDDNPNKVERNKKASKSLKGKEKVKRIDLTQNCPKCGKIFTISVSEIKYKKNKFKKFCSRKCANTRKHSDETKNKISKTLIEKGICPPNSKNKKTQHNDRFVINKCEYCGKEFKIKWTKRHQKCCSISCSSKKRGGWLTVHRSNINWSEINKKSYANGNNYVAGGTTKWLKYNNIKVQGTYELRACYILDKMKEIGEIKNWEYSKDKINYIGTDGKNHTYIIDFRLILKDDTIKNLEIKGRIKENDIIKWETARNKGIILDVWFLNDIKDLEKKLSINSKK